MQSISLHQKRAGSLAGGTASYPTPWYWLLTRLRVSGLEVFTESTSKGEVILPVFGSADDAVGYLTEELSSWKPRKTGRGELASVLMGVCREVRWVTLDPPPRAATEEALKVLGLSRDNFLEPLLGRDRSWFEEERNKRQRPSAHGLLSRTIRKTTVESRKAF